MTNWPGQLHIRGVGHEESTEEICWPDPRRGSHSHDPVKHHRPEKLSTVLIENINYLKKSPASKQGERGKGGKGRWGRSQLTPRQEEGKQKIMNQIYKHSDQHWNKFSLAFNYVIHTNPLIYCTGTSISSIPLNPVLWIRNDLFRIRIQLWIFLVPDPDPGKSSAWIRTGSNLY